MKKVIVGGVEISIPPMLFVLFFKGRNGMMSLRHKFHIIGNAGNVFLPGKNTLSILAFPVIAKKFVSQQKELCVFRAQLRLRTFFVFIFYV